MSYGTNFVLNIKTKTSRERAEKCRPDRLCMKTVKQDSAAKKCCYSENKTKDDFKKKNYCRGLAMKV